MATKELITRIALKYDSYSAWTTAPGKDLVLLPGELGICHISDSNQESHVVPTVLFKVGDGTKTFEQLPWASAKAADVYSWAKASEVKRDGKKLVFVGGGAGGSNIEVAFDYVTLSEVQAITNGLDTRITALESSVGASGDIGKAVADHETRLGVIEGEGEGSVAKALADAKSYTDTRESAIKTAYEAYADQAETDAKSYADTELAKDRSRITAVENSITTINGTGAGSISKAVADAVTEVKAYADTAETDAVNTAKGYTDTREAAIKTAYEKYADDAEAAANSYTDGKVATINAKDEAQDVEIGKKLDKTTYEAYIAGKELSDEALKSYAESVASTAQTNAETNAAADAAAKVKALEDGKVATNAAAISAMDTAYKAADSALSGRLDTVEGKLANVTNVMDFVGAVSALPESTEGYNDGDVIVVTDGDDAGKEFVVSNGDFVEFGYADGNTAAIETLQGRMDTAESDIDNLETRAGNLEAADTRIDGRIDALVGDNGTIATTAATTLASAQSYADQKASAAESAAKTHAEQKASAAQAAAEATAAGALSSAVSTLNAKDTEIAGNVTTLQDIVNGYSTKGSIKTAIEAAASAASTADGKAVAAQQAADKAQGEIDALELVVGNATTGLEATKTIADRADAKSIANAGRLDTAEGNITTLQGIVQTGANSNANLRTAITDLQTLTGESGAIRTEIAAAKKAGDDAAKAVDDLAKGQVATNKSDISTLSGKVTAIENDYLKAADVYIFKCGTATTVTHEEETQA
jgi:hypothetical protein